jgi:hypothetical protein
MTSSASAVSRASIPGQTNDTAVIKKAVAGCDGVLVSLDGQDVHSWRFKAFVRTAGLLARVTRSVDLDDQVEACRRVFESDTRWTVVRCSDLEEGESEGLPVWRRHVRDPILESNITRRIDFALFMVDTLEGDELVHGAPAIVSRPSPSALAHGEA